MIEIICPICGTKKQYKNGFRTYCSKSCANKGTPKTIKNRFDHSEIIRLIKSGASRIDVAEQLGCSISTVDRVRLNYKRKIRGNKDEVI